MLGVCSPAPLPACAPLMGRTSGHSFQGRSRAGAQTSVSGRPLPGGAAFFCPHQSPGDSVNLGVQAWKSCLLCPHWPPSLALKGSGRVPPSQRREGQGCGGWATLWGDPHLFSPGAALRATYGPSLLRGGPVTLSLEPGSSAKGAWRARRLPLSRLPPGALRIGEVAAPEL